MQRREFLKLAGVGAAEAAALLAWDAHNNPLGAADGLARPGPIAYGSLDGRSADRNGIVLPEGFTSNVIAVGGERVGNTGYDWHAFSDGAACIRTPTGWYYVANSEVPSARGGGASVIEFDAQGKIVDAARVLEGTSTNCSGGATPWNTWLSCEETANGFVWECDPTRKRPARPLPALGEFRHEAAAVDAIDKVVYLTEDEPDGRLYRFVPDAWPSLDRGRLEALQLGAAGALAWSPIAKPSGWGDTPTRAQVPSATAFNGGEGAWISGRTLYFTTKGDNRVHALDLQAQKYRVIYDLDAPLNGVDQLIVDPVLSNIFVAEDAGNMEIVVINPRGNTAPFLRVEGHDGSEISGLAFSPDLSRLYFSSQRAPTPKTMRQLDPTVNDDNTVGVVYEVTGPFIGAAATGRVIERAGTGRTDRTNVPYAVGGAVGVAAIAAGAIAAFRQRTRQL